MTVFLPLALQQINFFLQKQENHICKKKRRNIFIHSTLIINTQQKDYLFLNKKYLIKG